MKIQKMNNQITLVLITIGLILVLSFIGSVSAQTNWTGLYSNASKIITNASKLINQALTNPPETPESCAKLHQMSPTVPANKTIAENPLSLWAYTAGMKAALKSCEKIGK